MLLQLRAREEGERLMTLPPSRTCSRVGTLLHAIECLAAAGAVARRKEAVRLLLAYRDGWMDDPGLAAWSGDNVGHLPVGAHRGLGDAAEQAYWEHVSVVQREREARDAEREAWEAARKQAGDAAEAGDPSGSGKDSDSDGDGASSGGSDGEHSGADSDGSDGGDGGDGSDGGGGGRGRRRRKPRKARKPKPGESTRPLPEGVAAFEVADIKGEILRARQEMRDKLREAGACARVRACVC